MMTLKKFLAMAGLPMTIRAWPDAAEAVQAGQKALTDAALASSRSLNGTQYQSAVNELTGDDTRMPRPKWDLWSAEEQHKLLAKIRDAKGKPITILDREYWADSDGLVYVVAWKDANAVSGDPMFGPVTPKSVTIPRRSFDFKGCA